MLGKIAFLLFVSMVACSPIAKEWPADLLPVLCPDYPNCDMEVLAKFAPDGHLRPAEVPILRVTGCFAVGICF